MRLPPECLCCAKPMRYAGSAGVHGLANYECAGCKFSAMATAPTMLSRWLDLWLEWLDQFRHFIVPVEVSGGSEHPIADPSIEQLRNSDFALIERRMMAHLR
jgi:hypothetical protein